MSWFNIIGSGDFLDDQRAIASGIALVLSFVHVCLPNTRLNKKLFTLRDPNAAEPPSYSEAVFYFSSVKIPFLSKNLKHSTDIWSRKPCHQAE